MKVLYLLRHAKSDWDDPTLDDFDRPLAKRGRRAAKAMAEHFHQACLSPATILCSPAERTRETLRLLGGGLADMPVSFDKRLYEASSTALLDCLRELPSSVPSVLLVGHNPGLQHLVIALLDHAGDATQAAALRAKFPTCALAILSVDTADWQGLRTGACRLDSFISPADLGA